MLLRSHAEDSGASIAFVTDRPSVMAGKAGHVSRLFLTLRFHDSRKASNNSNNNTNSKSILNQY